jgi:hypothetical protein
LIQFFPKQKKPKFSTLRINHRVFYFNLFFKPPTKRLRLFEIKKKKNLGICRFLKLGQELEQICAEFKISNFCSSFCQLKDKKKKKLKSFKHCWTNQLRSHKKKDFFHLTKLWILSKITLDFRKANLTFNLGFSKKSGNRLGSLAKLLFLSLFLSCTPVKPWEKKRCQDFRFLTQDVFSTVQKFRFILKQMLKSWLDEKQRFLTKDFLQTNHRFTSSKSQLNCCLKKKQRLLIQMSDLKILRFSGIGCNILWYTYMKNFSSKQTQLRTSIKKYPNRKKFLKFLFKNAHSRSLTQLRYIQKKKNHFVYDTYKQHLEYHSIDLDRNRRFQLESLKTKSNMIFFVNTKYKKVENAHAAKSTLFDDCLDSLFHLFLKIKQNEIKLQNLSKMKPSPNQLFNLLKNSSFENDQQKSKFPKLGKRLEHCGAKLKNTNSAQTYLFSCLSSYQFNYYLKSITTTQTTKVDKKLIFKNKKTSDFLWFHQKIYDFLLKSFFLGENFLKKKLHLQKKKLSLKPSVSTTQNDSQTSLFNMKKTKYTNKKKDKNTKNPIYESLDSKGKIFSFLTDFFRSYLSFCHNNENNFKNLLNIIPSEMWMFFNFILLHNFLCVIIRTNTIFHFDVARKESQKIKTISFFYTIRKQQQSINSNQNVFSTRLESSQKLNIQLLQPLFLNNKIKQTKNISLNKNKYYTWMFLNKINMIDFFKLKENFVHDKYLRLFRMYRQFEKIRRILYCSLNQESKNFPFFRQYLAFSFFYFLRCLMETYIVRRSIDCQLNPVSSQSIHSLKSDVGKGTWLETKDFFPLLRFLESLNLTSTWQQPSQSNLLNFSTTYLQRKKKLQGFPCFIVTKRVVSHKELWLNAENLITNPSLDSLRQIKKTKIFSSFVDLSTFKVKRLDSFQISLFPNIENIRFSFFLKLLNQKLFKNKILKVKKKTKRWLECSNFEKRQVKVLDQLGKVQNFQFTVSNVKLRLYKFKEFLPRFKLEKLNKRINNEKQQSKFSTFKQNESFLTSLQLKRLKNLVQNYRNLPVNQLIVKLNEEILKQLKNPCFFLHQNQVKTLRFRQKKIEPIPIYLFIGKCTFLGSLGKTSDWIQAKQIQIQSIQKKKSFIDLGNDESINDFRKKNYLFQLLWKWAKRRHNNRSNRWIFHRYWHKNLFYYENKLSKYYLLDYTLQRKKYLML